MSPGIITHLAQSPTPPSPEWLSFLNVPGILYVVPLFLQQDYLFLHFTGNEIDQKS